MGKPTWPPCAGCHSVTCAPTSPGCGRLAAAGAVAVNGGTFDLNGQNQTVGSLSGTGGTVGLNGGAALTVNQAANTS